MPINMQAETALAWQKILESAIVPTIGIFLGAGITYFVQTRLEDSRRRKAQRHFAYGLLVQVAESAARFEHMSSQIATLGSSLTKENFPESEKFERADFWCALIGELLRKDESMGKVLDGFGPTLDALSDYLTTTLSGLQIKGRDLADLPKEVIAAHQRASNSLSIVKQGLDGLVATIRADRTSLRDEIIRLTWTEVQRMGLTLVDLRSKLRIAAGASQEEVLAIEREAIVHAQLTVSEATRRAQALPAAAEAVKGFLARHQAQRREACNDL